VLNPPSTAPFSTAPEPATALPLLPACDIGAIEAAATTVVQEELLSIVDDCGNCTCACETVLLGERGPTDRYCICQCLSHQHACQRTRPSLPGLANMRKPRQLSGSITSGPGLQRARTSTKIEQAISGSTTTDAKYTDHGNYLRSRRFCEFACNGHLLVAVPSLA
jgi:hypothetical protein